VKEFRQFLKDWMPQARLSYEARSRDGICLGIFMTGKRCSNDAVKALSHEMRILLKAAHLRLYKEVRGADMLLSKGSTIHPRDPDRLCGVLSDARWLASTFTSLGL